jgi:hypothetical protein
MQWNNKIPWDEEGDNNFYFWRKEIKTNFSNDQFFSQKFMTYFYFVIFKVVFHCRNLLFLYCCAGLGYMSIFIEISCKSFESILWNIFKCSKILSWWSLQILHLINDHIAFLSWNTFIPQVFWISIQLNNGSEIADSCT